MYTTSPPTQHHSFFRNYPFIRVLQIRVLQIRVLQISVLQIRVLQIRVLQIRVLQIRVLQIHVLQIRLLQIQSVFYKSNPVDLLQYANLEGQTKSIMVFSEVAYCCAELNS